MAGGGVEGVVVWSPFPSISALYLKIRFQSRPHVPVTQGGSLVHVHFDPLLPILRTQTRVGLIPGDVQHCLTHID